MFVSELIQSLNSEEGSCSEAVTSPLFISLSTSPSSVTNALWSILLEPFLACSTGPKATVNVWLLKESASISSIWSANVLNVSVVRFLIDVSLTVFRLSSSTKVSKLERILYYEQK